MAAYLPHIKNAQDAYISIKSSKTNWKTKHEDIIRAVKAAKGEKVDDQLITTKSIDSGECSHCAQNFECKLYDRMSFSEKRLKAYLPHQ